MSEIQPMFVRMGFLLSCFATASEAANWLQYGHDQAHSGWNSEEKGYSTETGNRLIYAVDLAGFFSPAYVQFESQPVFVSNVTTPSGVKDVLFAMSTTGMLIAIDAANGAVLWSKQASGPGGVTRSTPAIDLSLTYVFAHGADGKIHKYQVADGIEVVANGWPQVSTLKPDVEKGASGLTIASTQSGTFLYSVTSGYYGDMGDYQGHLTAVNLNTGVQNVFNSLCSDKAFHFVEGGTSADDCTVEGGRMSGIWGAAGAVYDSQTDRVYIATGNGLFDANIQGGREWGDSVLALKPDGTGTGMGYPVDSYTPMTFGDLYAGDLDLGSASPAVLPAPATSKYKHLGLQNGKDHCVRLIDLDDLSGQGGPGHVGGELNADACAVGLGGAQPTAWVDPENGSTWVFVTGGYTTAFQLTVDDAGNPQLAQKWQLPHQVYGTISNSAAIIGNNELYYTTFDSIVYAVNPRTGDVIWQDASLNEYTFWDKPPIVVNEKLYFAFGSSIAAFQLDGVFRSGFEEH